MSMTLRLTAEQDELLSELARSEGVSKQEAVIRAIAERAARLTQDSEVRTAARGAVAEYGPLLDRLSK
ncbi:ribbon-helix-helix protein, CopG family [Rhodococcus sp. NPDC058505]|uniref:ribbon-helix-helix protein, CopG family n=1 Tax=Rhodococcus sp. NPDC058505 TaxID=3346531 RepID=UPI0036577BDF